MGEFVPGYNGTYAPLQIGTSGPVTRLRAVAIGDSTTQGGLSDVFGTGAVVGAGYSFTSPLVGFEQAGSGSWLTHACALSGGRLLLVHNAGVGSDNTTGMVSRFATDVAAFRPSIVFIMGGHNDSSSGPTATTRTNIDTLVGKVRAIGAMPVLCTLYPENNATYQKNIRTHNAWLRMYAAANALLCLDLYAAVVDVTSTTGNWTASYTSDGTHANVAGAAVAGQRAVDDLAGILRGNTTKWGPWAANDRTTDLNLFSNPLAQDDANADGIADGWTVSANTHSLITDSAVLGKAQQADITSGVGYLRRELTVNGTTLSVGDRLRIAGVFKATAAAGSLNWELLIYNLGGTRQQVAPWPQVVGEDVSWRYFEVDYVVPASSTTIRAGLETAAGTGSLWLAQVACYNLTALGVVV